MREVLITGATGRIGRRVLAALAAHPAVSPRVLVRDPDKARELYGAGLRAFVGDFADAESLVPAVSGVAAILLVSPVHPDQRRLQGNVVRAAAEQGAPLVVKISGVGTALDSYVDSGRWHAEGEADIVASGLPYTFLRPYFFMQNLTFQLDAARRDGVVRAAVGDARIAMVDAGDIAGVCSELLSGEATLANRAVALTGDQAVTYHEVAAQLGVALGRDVRYEQQTLEAARASLAAGNQPDWHVEILLQFNRAFRDGWGEPTTTVVADVLGRRPVSLDRFLQDVVASKSGEPLDRDPFPNR